MWLGWIDAFAPKPLAAASSASACAPSRSASRAVQPTMRELGSRLAAAKPARGMVIVAENDHYAGTPEMHAFVADSVGASVCPLAGVGHWWMVEDPAASADALIAHWRG